MGIVDVLSKEDRISVKFSDLYSLVKGCTQTDMLMNGIQCNVPHKYMREMMTGKSEDNTVQESTEIVSVEEREGK